MSRNHISSENKCRKRTSTDGIVIPKKLSKIKNDSPMLQNFTTMLCRNQET